MQRTVGHRGEIGFDTRKPDGAPRKLMDCEPARERRLVGTHAAAEGLRLAIAEFEAQEA